MKLLKRLQFAFKYDIDPDFIVMPFGNNDFLPSRFTKFEDAAEFTEKEVKEKPMFGKPEVLVRIRRAR